MAADVLHRRFVSIFVLSAFCEYLSNFYRYVFGYNTHFPEFFVKTIENVDAAQGLIQHAYNYRGNNKREKENDNSSPNGISTCQWI